MLPMFKTVVSVQEILQFQQSWHPTLCLVAYCHIGIWVWSGHIHMAVLVVAMYIQK